MSPIITIDWGNSNPHFRVYLDDVANDPSPLDRLPKEENAIFLISKVGNDNSLLKELNGEVVDFKDHRKENSFLSMPVNYTETLGEDRLYQVYHLYKNTSKPHILIDAGTFITIDFISDSGLDGGFIFPGEQVFLESYQRGAQLPKLSTKELSFSSSPIIPHSTEEAILEATKSYLINTYKGIFENNPQAEITLTGGNSERHLSLLKKLFPERVIYLMPHLIHDSLIGIYKEISSLPHQSQE